jgi:carbamoyl-phosphate synthase large subunit
MGLSKAEIFELSKIDPWFLTQIEEIIAQEKLITTATLTDEPQLRRLKTEGFSDKNIARLITLNGGSAKENDVYEARKALAIMFEYNEVDTCAAEFGSLTPYLYSTTNITRLGLQAPRQSDKKKVMILGGGPNRIGQGIEFDYCCVHASFALKEMGIETIMVNCNPETVSTD